MHRSISQRYWLYLIPVVLLAVPLYRIRARYSLEGQLHYHRELWQSRKIPHYSYILKEYPSSIEATVEIRSGKVVKFTVQEGYARDFDLRPAPVEDFLSVLEKDIEGLRQGKIQAVQVRYDSYYGYPMIVEKYLPCIPPHCNASSGEATG